MEPEKRTPEHEHPTPDERIDESIDESFPASDPPTYGGAVPGSPRRNTDRSPGRR